MEGYIDPKTLNDGCPKCPIIQEAATKRTRLETEITETKQRIAELKDKLAKIDTSRVSSSVEAIGLRSLAAIIDALRRSGPTNELQVLQEYYEQLVITSTTLANLAAKVRNSCGGRPASTDDTKSYGCISADTGSTDIILQTKPLD